MSARDAIDRLARNRAARRDPFPNRWPLDHVTIPPGDETVAVCRLWPECQCDGDCAAQVRAAGERLFLSLFLLAVTTAAVLVGLGLIWGLVWLGLGR